MPKFDENKKCNFFEYDCFYPIPEDVLKELLEDAEEEEVISMVPEIDTIMCTNCLLATLIEIMSIERK